MDYTLMNGHMKMKRRNMNGSAPLHSVDCHAPCLLPCLFPVWNCARGWNIFAWNQKPLLFYAGRRIVPQVPTHCDIPHDDWAGQWCAILVGWLWARTTGLYWPREDEETWQICFNVLEIGYISTRVQLAISGPKTFIFVEKGILYWVIISRGSEFRILIELNWNHCGQPADFTKCMPVKWYLVDK